MDRRVYIRHLISHTSVVLKMRPGICIFHFMDSSQLLLEHSNQTLAFATAEREKEKKGERERERDGQMFGRDKDTERGKEKEGSESILSRERAVSKFDICPLSV